MMQHGVGVVGGKIVMHQGKALVYLNPKCGGNHYFCDCSNRSNQYKVTIFDTTKKKWDAEKIA